MSKKYSLFVSKISKQCSFCCIENIDNSQIVIGLKTFYEDELSKKLKEYRIDFQGYGQILNMNISNESISLTEEIKKLGFKPNYIAVNDWNMIKNTSASILDKNIKFKNQVMEVRAYRDISNSMAHRIIKPVLGSIALISENQREGDMIDLFKVHQLL